jgi:hypothetical protein
MDFPCHVSPPRHLIKLLIFCRRNSKLSKNPFSGAKNLVGDVMCHRRLHWQARRIGKQDIVTNHGTIL